MLRHDTRLELDELRKVASEMSGELCAIGLHDIDRPLTISLQHNHACICTQSLDDDEGLYIQLYWLWPDYQSLDCPTLSAF